MLTREEARQLLLERLKIREDDRGQFVAEDRTLERSFGWLFFVAVATAHIAAQPGVLRYRLIIVNKHSNQVIESSIEYTPERFIDIYENFLAMTQAQGLNWCLTMSLPFPWKRFVATKAKRMGLYELKSFDDVISEFQARDVAQLVKDGRLQEALTLLQDRRGKDGRARREPIHELLDDLGELKRAGAPLTAIVGLFVKQMVVLMVLILVLTAVGLGVAEWTLFPAMNWLFAIVMPLVFAPGGLPVLALAMFVCGLVFARKVRSPFMFMAGITGVSLGLMCFWLFPFYIRLLQQLPPEAEVPLLIVGGVISLLIFVCGIQLVAQANN